MFKKKVCQAVVLKKYNKCKININKSDHLEIVKG